MPLSRWTLLVPLLAASSLSAQTRTIAERLGHPADAKLLIIHADDLAVAHSVNVASFDALERGAVTSASIMVPTPWLTEVAAFARTHPNADLGLHLTITSEWETYRWGSVAPSSSVPSLLDSTGTFPKNVQPVVARAKPEEIERELRAQVERALALGIRPALPDAAIDHLPRHNSEATGIELAKVDDVDGHDGNVTCTRRRLRAEYCIACATLTPYLSAGLSAMEMTWPPKFVLSPV